MKPTNEELSDLADAYRIAANTQPAGSVASVIAYALRLAANMPSAEEIHNLMAETISEDQPLFKTAARILERIRSVK